MSKNQSRLVLPALISLLGLAGCGGPSEDEVRQAIYASTLQPLAALAGRSGQGPSPEDQAALKSIHLIACDKAGTDTYTCNVTGFMGQGVATTVTLAKTDAGWVMVSR